MAWQISRIPLGGFGHEWYSVAWSPELRVFVACGLRRNSFPDDDEGVIAVSSNGQDWTVQALLVGVNWRIIRWIPELRRFVGLGEGTDTTYVMESTDAAAWSTELIADDNRFESLAYSPVHRKLVAMNRASSNNLLVKPNGGGWEHYKQSNDLAFSLEWISERHMFVAVRQEGVKWAGDIRPGDGLMNIESVGSGFHPSSLAFSPEKGLIAVMADYVPSEVPEGSGVAVGRLPSSLTVHPQLDKRMIGIVWVPDSQRFVSVGFTQQDGTAVFASEEGDSWSEVARMEDELGLFPSLAWSPELGVLIGGANGSLVRVTGLPITRTSFWTGFEGAREVFRG